MQSPRDPPPERLAARLRRETAAMHDAAERTPLMAALIAGRIDRAAYVALLANLLPLYRTLESGLARHRGNARLAFANAPGLARAERIEQDLATLGPARDDALADATRAYCAHLLALAERQPLALAAHAYVRYLGDLYGGQALARTVQRGLGLHDGEGTRFYDFGPAASLPAQRAAFRAGLDALDEVPADADVMVNEARVGFTRHLQLFEELAASG